MIDIFTLQQLNNETLMCFIREKYKTPSFFEMIDKTRNETSHSALLRWMLSGEGISAMTTDSPVLMFLNLLVKRMYPSGYTLRATDIFSEKQ